MKRFTFSVAVAAILGLAAFSLADAQGGRRGMGRMDGQDPAGPQQERGFGGPRRGPGWRGGGPGFALRGLDLTDEQRAQIRGIHESERQAQQGPPADVQLHRELQAAVFADTPDAAKIAALEQQLVQAHSERLARRIAIQQKVAQVLTPEQRAQARERLTARRGRVVK